MSGDFILESDGSVLARAQKPSAFRRCFIVEHTDELLQIYNLVKGGVFVGQACPVVDFETDAMICISLSCSFDKFRHKIIAVKRSEAQVFHFK